MFETVLELVLFHTHIKGKTTTRMPVCGSFPPAMLQDPVFSHVEALNLLMREFQLVLDVYQKGAFAMLVKNAPKLRKMMHPLPDIERQINIILCR